jgi:hypothetical protein
MPKVLNCQIERFLKQINVSRNVSCNLRPQLMLLPKNESRTVPLPVQHIIDQFIIKQEHHFCDQDSHLHPCHATSHQCEFYILENACTYFCPMHAHSSSKNGLPLSQLSVLLESHHISGSNLSRTLKFLSLCVEGKVCMLTVVCSLHQPYSSLPSLQIHQ